MNLTPTNEALLHVLQERLRQDQLRRDGKFTFGPADPELSDAELLTVLTEEVGEVAHEINETIGHPERITRAQRIRLRDELVQVAAVAVGRVELLDRQIADLTQYGQPGHRPRCTWPPGADIDEDGEDFRNSFEVPQRSGLK